MSIRSNQNFFFYCSLTFIFFAVLFTQTHADISSIKLMNEKLVNLIDQVKRNNDPIPSFPPQLPSAFNATATTTLPFIGKVTGPFYFDYDNSRIRTDVTMFGSTQASLAFYNDKIQYDLMLPSGPCQLKQLTEPLYPFIIPPFASFVGFENLNSKNCQHWKVILSPLIMDYWVTYDSSQDDGKESFYIVRFSMNSDPSSPMPVNIQMDFANVKVGPQPESLFSIWKNAGCPAPKPPTYSVSGYTKNAMNGQVVPNIQLSMSDGKPKISITSDRNGVFTFDKILAQISGNINAGTVADLFRIDSSQDY